MRRPKKDSAAIIDCGNADEAHLAYIAMFRYAFGCITYMPGVVIEIIKRNAATLTMRTLVQLNTELAEEAARYERVYAKREHPDHGSNYGMECDRQKWLAFQAWVRERIKEREEKEGAKA